MSENFTVHKYSRVFILQDDTFGVCLGKTVLFLVVLAPVDTLDVPSSKYPV
jgi:hypothetical protein